MSNLKKIIKTVEQMIERFWFLQLKAEVHDSPCISFLKVHKHKTMHKKNTWKWVVGNDWLVLKGYLYIWTVCYAYVTLIVYYLLYIPRAGTLGSYFMSDEHTSLKSRWKVILKGLPNEIELGCTWYSWTGIIKRFSCGFKDFLLHSQLLINTL
jgi:hypothetical protein